MATSTHFLRQETLFALSPQCSQAPGDLCNQQYVDKATLAQLLDSTYFVIRGDTLGSAADILMVWEVRLSLLLFTDQLGAAKREAVALNNALYLHENPGAARPANPALVKPQGPGNGPGPGPASVSVSAPPVYPLPTNNDGAISDSLLSLVLSLKSGPSMARVNEIYRLCYQKRLKGDSVRVNGAPNDVPSLAHPNHSNPTGLQASLMALSYGVIAVLFVSRNYATLDSFLVSLRHDLKADPSNGAYHSNVTLMWLLAKIYMRRASGTVDSTEASVWGPLYDENLGEIAVETWTALTFVTSKVGAQLGGSVFPIVVSPETVSVAQLADLVAQDRISVRTVCCLLALWSLAATNHTNLSQDEFTIIPDQGHHSGDTAAGTSGDSSDNMSGVGYVTRYIRSRWGDFYNKLYGLE
ncbi:hypothetical protein JCM33374_g3190 [Metschnikowia sp. JCM 33374]|nr:hypothetical protein JCM33374_g3190 [Metschnikowia sp. JCM 33374]